MADNKRDWSDINWGDLGDPECASRELVAEFCPDLPEDRKTAFANAIESVILSYGDIVAANVAVSM